MLSSTLTVKIQWPYIHTYAFIYIYTHAYIIYVHMLYKDFIFNKANQGKNQTKTIGLYIRNIFTSQNW